MSWFKTFRAGTSNMELARFAFYVLAPISCMIYVGTDTHSKLNVPDFWPDPERLNRIPKDPVEIKAEVERLRFERIERRKRLEEKAKLLNIEPPKEQ